MQLSSEPVIYGFIFIAVIVLVEGLYLVAFGKSISLNSRVNRRLEMLDKGAGREQVLEQLRKEMQQHMKSRSIPLYSLLADRAQKAAIAFTPRQLVMIMGGLAVFALYDMIVQLQRGGMGGTAHAAHVGGMVGGVLLFRFRGALAQRDIERETRTVRKEKDKAKDDEAELDRILEKIHDEGMSKLTKAERRFLETRSKNKS